MLTIKNAKNTVWADIPLDDLARGNALDIHFTYLIDDILEDGYDSDKQKKLLDYILNPLLVHVARMEYNGIDISEENMQALGSKLNYAIIEKEDSLYLIDGVETSDNLKSSEDLGNILYGREGGMELYPPDWTAKDKPKTCKNTLGILLEQIDDELERRSSKP
jgi:DNA polymerase I-like protein with 3'-5' exonuclease and polymerase domains